MPSFQCCIFKCIGEAERAIFASEVFDGTGYAIV